ncbi:hypothetical protein BJY52DRAFT_1264910 [Lactarius psammicola]|nr:hypothetical protein BJY52DRAFT_1264910 [Lactarius psammicola]
MMLTRTIIALSLAVYALSAPPQKRAGILGVGDLKGGLVPDFDSLEGSLLSSVGTGLPVPAGLPAGLPAGFPGLSARAPG